MDTLGIDVGSQGLLFALGESSPHYLKKAQELIEIVKHLKRTGSRSEYIHMVCTPCLQHFTM